MTGKMMNLGGVPIMVPNTTYQKKGFYVSYNDRDRRIYGSDTTALVVGDEKKFLILDGNHVEQYEAFGNNLEKCLEYFKQNEKLMNSYSETV